MAKRTRAAPSAYEEFVFWVREPSTRYGFSLSHDRRTDDAFEEDVIVTFVAECLYPFRFKGRLASVRLSEGLDLATLNSGRFNPPQLSVGFLHVTPSRFEVWSDLPGRACWRIADSIANGTITSMSLNVHALVRGKGHAIAISFHGPDFDPVEYVG